MNLRKQLLPVTTFARIDIKRLFRDKVAIFFVFVFPLMFLLIFGTIFKNDGGDMSFKVAIINRSDREFAKKFVDQSKKYEFLEVDKEIKTLDQARQKMNRGELDAAVILPEGFGAIDEKRYPTGELEVLYDQNNEQAGQTLAATLEGAFIKINNEIVPSETPFTVSAKSTATEGQTRFDYTFSGLLGFTLLSLGVFGPTTVFPRLKQKGVLRRYHTTTIKVWQYFLGNVISNAAVGLMAVALMFATAVLAFDLNMQGSYLAFAAIAVFGTVLMFGIGLAVGGWAKNENQAAPIAQLITLPMMFLSGVFFPVFLMPEWLRNITRFIPLTPIVDSVRYIVTEGKSFFDLGPQLLVMAVWTVVIYLVAFKAFRWE